MRHDGNPLRALCPYEIKHLPAHLGAARRFGDLHRLLRLSYPDVGIDATEPLTRNAWFETKVPVHGESGFLDDVRLAASSAAGDARRANLSGIASRSVGFEVRYGLYRASLNSRAANLPAKLVVALVKRDSWQLVQAVNHVRRNSDQAVRAEVIVGLAAEIADDPTEATRLLGDVVREELRARCLVALGMHARAPLLSEIIRVSLELGSRTQRSFALLGLAPQIARLPVADWKRISSRIGPPQAQAAFLSAIMPNAPTEGHETLLELSMHLRSPVSRFKALHALAGILPDPLHAVAQRESFAAAREIKGAYSQAMALTKLNEIKAASRLIPSIEHIDERREVQACVNSRRPRKRPASDLIEALRITDARRRANAVDHLGPSLTSDVADVVLDAVSRFSDRLQRGNALRELAPRLDPATFEVAFWHAIRSVDRGDHSSSVAEALLPSTPCPLLARAVEAYEAALGDAVGAAPALVARLGECGLNEQVLRMVSKTQAKARVRALAAWAPHIPESMREQALQLAWTVKPSRERHLAVGAVAESLTPQMLQGAAAQLVEIGDADRALRTTVALGVGLPEVERSALEAARKIVGVTPRREAFVDLAKHGSPNLLPDVVSSINARNDRNSEHETVAALAERRIADGDWRDALYLTGTIVDGVERANLVGRVAPTLPQDLLPLALKVARGIRHEPARVEALAALASRDRAELFAEALSVARAITDWRTAINGDDYAALGNMSSMVDIFELMQLTYVEDVPGGRQGFVDPYTAFDRWAAGELRSNALTTIARRQAQCLTFRDSMDTVLEIGGRHARARALVAILPYAPATRLDELSQECLQAIVEATRYGSPLVFYPTWVAVQALGELASVIPISLANRFVEATHSIRDAWPADLTHVDVLTHSLSRIGLEWSDGLLTKLRPTIEDVVGRRGEGLRAFGMLQMSLSDATVRLATRRRDSVGDELCRQAFDEAVAIRSDLRADAMVALAPNLSHALLIEALGVVSALQNEDARATGLAGVGHHLLTRAPDQPNDALSTVLRIEDRSARFRALSELCEDVRAIGIRDLGLYWSSCDETGASVVSLASSRSRQNLLVDLHALHQVIATIGGAEAVTEILSAIDDVESWWH